MTTASQESRGWQGSSAWQGFNSGLWQKEMNVRDFIQQNYTPYEDNKSFHSIVGDDRRPVVTKTSFRFLQTLYNLGAAPEQNLTIWYSLRLPDGFRSFALKISIDTGSLQFESDEISKLGNVQQVDVCPFIQWADLKI